MSRYEVSENVEFSPDLSHENILLNRKKLLSFDPNADYQVWKNAVRERLDDLLGDMPEKVDLKVEVEWEKEEETFIERRFTFYSEYRTLVPCHLLIPKTGKGKYPMVICLQGHSSGMHISLGRPKYEGDAALVADGDRDFAPQIVKEGYAALVVEQRGFGERRTPKHHGDNNTTCAHPSMVALLLGRTMARERGWDISRAIDAVGETFKDIDMDKIALMGNSGGGTATYYTACFEPRIKVVMPSCAVCSFDTSIGTLRHCDCNYIPRMAKYFDMGEIACLIAPRPLIVVAGAKDHGFLYPGVEKVYDVIKQIYEKEGAPENCQLITGDAGHRFYADISWPVFRKYFVGE
ncbi:MAG: hypothetical protein E7588_00820 [Ruminococcaceae bacterium]|nr:hypothetical protein [Oscillospiraceae bacterium]